MTSRFRAGLGVSLYYAFLFVAMGVQIPFWPLWLSARGLGPTQIGLALAATYFARIVATPLTGALSDRLRQRRRPMIWLALGATLAWAMFAAAPNLAAIIAVTLVAQGLWTGLMPLGDTLAMATAVRWAIDYGRMRLWGSATFIATSILTGVLLDRGDPSLLVWAIVGGLAATAITCWLLEDVPPQPHLSETHKAESGSIRELFADRAFLWFLAATGCNQISHTIYYGFSSIHWAGAGLSSRTIGLLWAEGVVAEIVLFAFSGAVIGRLGAKGLLTMAALGGMIRWTALGLGTSLAVLIPAQILHAATFCAAHLGAMVFVQHAIPSTMSARAQGVYAALACGAGPGLMALVSGDLYRSLGGAAFLVMAAVSALALIACLNIAFDHRKMEMVKAR